jgi:hypothetical protein
MSAPPEPGLAHGAHREPADTRGTAPPVEVRATDGSAPPAPAGSAADGDSPLRAAVPVLTTLGPPLTIATALMFYFGWLALHQRVDRALAQPAARPGLRRAGRVALGARLVAAAGAVLVAVLDRARWPLVVPLVLAAGTAVAAYGGWLAGAAADPRPGPVGPPWQRALRALLVGTVITLALFWEMSVYAGMVGRGYALELARTLPSRPRATAFSPTPLGIEAPGVHEERLAVGSAGGKDEVRYRTTGLRFLVRSGGRLFLVHDGWTPRRGTVIVLPDTTRSAGSSPAEADGLSRRRGGRPWR